MIKIREYEVKNNVEELSVEQFETVAGITNDLGLDYLDKQMQIFEFLGVPPEAWEDMEVDEFKKAVEEFNATEPKDYEFTSEIEIDGYTYKSFDKEFSLTIKDLKLIEKAVKTDGKKWMATSLAVIFKRTDLTKAEHYASAHIKQKAKLFKDVNASIAIPFIQYIGKQLNTALEQKVDEVTEGVE